MKITTKARYAVTAMVHIADECCGNPITLAQIAQDNDISLAYLEQLFCRLRRAGLVRSVRGPGGGYLLELPAAEISVGDVLRAVGEAVQGTPCREGAQLSPCQQARERGDAEGRQKCLTHDLWQGLGEHINNYLDGVSLEDVVAQDLPLPLKATELSRPHGGVEARSETVGRNH